MWNFCIKILIVGAGGFLGSVSRFLMVQWIHKIINNSWFPYGTMAVNVLGSLMIGFLAGLFSTKGLFNPQMRLFFMIGLLGSFTTFSTFSYENLTLLQDSQLFAALANIVLSVTLSLVAVFFGYQISTLI